MCKISSGDFFAFVSIAFEMMSTVESAPLFLLLIVPFLSKYEVSSRQNGLWRGIRRPQDSLATKKSAAIKSRTGLELSAHVQVGAVKTMANWAPKTVHIRHPESAS